jgi:hypothetical protein
LVTEKQCDEAESLCQYDMLYNATYQNSSQIDGTPVDLFTWSDYAFFVRLFSRCLFHFQICHSMYWGFWMQGSAYNAFYLNHKDMTPNFRQNWFDFFSSPANSGLIQMTYGGFQYNLPKNKFVEAFDVLVTFLLSFLMEFWTENAALGSTCRTPTTARRYAISHRLPSVFYLFIIFFLF